MGPSGPRWTGKVELIEQKLDEPLRWRKPRRIFVNSMSDLFHERLSDVDIARVFAVMSEARQHVFQVLTKRPERMLRWISQVRKCEGGWITHDGTMPARAYDGTGVPMSGDEWPLPNVWLGVSTENQETANERIPLLMETPAAVRFVSAEPLLGPIDFTQWLHDSTCLALTDEGEDSTGCICSEPREVALDWIIVGGESGPGARPMATEWARSILHQCSYAQVPFFFKQWGETVDTDQMPDQTHREVDAVANLAGHPQRAWRVGKKAAGRLLDGQIWNEFPGHAEAPPGP